MPAGLSGGLARQREELGWEAAVARWDGAEVLTSWVLRLPLPPSGRLVTASILGLSLPPHP